MKIARILTMWCLLLGMALGIQPVQATAVQAETTTTSTAVAVPEVEMADALRRDGKIYVVVAVLLTLMVGIVAYLISLDRKVGKLEKQLKDEFVNR